MNAKNRGGLLPPRCTSFNSLNRYQHLRKSAVVRRRASSNRPSSPRRAKDREKLAPGRGANKAFNRMIHVSFTLSFVTCALNRVNSLRRCIDALFAVQTINERELFIVDNGSNDGTVERLRSLVSSQATPTPTVRVAIQPKVSIAKNAVGDPPVRTNQERHPGSEEPKARHLGCNLAKTAHGFARRHVSESSPTATVMDT